MKEKGFVPIIVIILVIAALAIILGLTLFMKETPPLPSSEPKTQTVEGQLDEVEKDLLDLDNLEKDLNTSELEELEGELDENLLEGI